MRDKVKAYKKGLTYLGVISEHEGYIGELDRQFIGVTQVISKPNCSLKDVIRSLEITIQDIELQIAQGDK